MEASNPRKGLPSASGISRLVKCLGSARKISELPESTAPEHPDDDANSGNKVHAYLDGNIVEGRKVPKLTSSEQSTAEECEELFEKACLMAFPDESTNRIQIKSEDRLWLFDENGNNVLSGQYDRRVTNYFGNRILLVDFKSLYGDHDPAADNWQLRTLAVLANENPDAQEIVVALIQPHAPDRENRLTMVEYNQADLRLAKENLLAIIGASNGAYAALLPGDHCIFCPAKNNCEKATSSVTELISVSLQNTPLENGKVLELFKLVESVIKDAKENAKIMLAADPDSIPGWEMKQGNNRTHLVDPALLFKRMQEDYGTTADAYLDAFKPSLSKIKDLLKTASQTKGKVLAAKWKDITDQCTLVTRDSDRLTKSKPVKEIEA